MCSIEPEALKVVKGFAPGTTQLIITNRDKSIMYRTDATPDILDLFNPDEYQIFVLGYLDPQDNYIYLGKRIPDQDW